jgi:hypothetical protein
MSPTTTTGRLAARARPMFAMSFIPQVDLCRAPRTLADDDLETSPQIFERLQHHRQKFPLHPW